MKIYGAGIAGLLAGCAFQDATIYEAGSEEQMQHKALLRFRSSAVGDSVGIDFKKVKVHKGIYEYDNFVQPNIWSSNNYSLKVTGKITDRSIWNLDPAERYIAPEDFIQQLVKRCRGRIVWNHKLTSEEIFNNQGQAISTLPMSLMNRFCAEAGIDISISDQFNYEPIIVRRWRIPDCNVYQTIYYPQPELSLFRASITGDLLIAEYMERPFEHPDDDQIELICRSFGLESTLLEKIEKVNQRFGKISAIDDQQRKKFINRLSTEKRIFSLGRFGTWRNILLDDVLKDINVIRKLVVASEYDISRANAK